MSIYRYDGQEPEIHEQTYVADTADVIGRVIMERGASIWYQAILRGDNETVTIRVNNNIQQCAVIPAIHLRSV